MKNVVLILADQLRQDYLGCFGNENVKTPNIDRIAEQGTCFDNCYVSNPFCMPSRASIFTGQYAHNHQLWANGVLLEHTPPTLGDHMKSAGYATALIGKAHLSPYGAFGDTPQSSMEDQRRWKNPEMLDWHGPYWGFDYVELTLNHSTRPDAHYGKWFFENGGTVQMISESNFGRKEPANTEVRTTNLPEELHDSLFIGKRSAEYIRDRAKMQQPFFLTASFPDPHHPYSPPAETYARYLQTPITLPIAEDDALENRPKHYGWHQKCIWHPAGPQQTAENMTDEEKARVPFYRQLAASMRKQGSDVVEVGRNSNRVTTQERNARIRSTYAMIDLVDQGVGCILSALEETGQLDNTVIIFAADHGELMGDHGLWKKGPFFYDGLMKTPLIINDPDIPGGRAAGLASLVDVFPTVAELTGLSKPESCDGISLKRTMQGKSDRRECLIEYRNGYLENELHGIAYIDEQYKFVRFNTGECELTDRVNDAEERVNLAADISNRELVNEYTAKLLDMLMRTAARYPTHISTF